MNFPLNVVMAKKTAVGLKISKLIKEGKSHKQAVAIAVQMHASGSLGPKGGYHPASGARSSGRGLKKQLRRRRHLRRK